MQKNKPSPCHLPELTSEECEILISILYQIDLNMKPFLETSYLLSPCAFTFDADYGMDDVFRGLYRKVQEISVLTRRSEESVSTKEGA